jgi:superfamily I DNA and/or RNA helicase
LRPCHQNLKGDDIGVIAPYAGQISCIVNEMRHDSKRQEQAWKTLGEKRSKEMNDVEVHTVDGFEGREKKIIVFSTTRSNDANSIGFLADWRRMNVGLTRAKAVSETDISEGISYVY